MASCQLAKSINVTQKTAWFILRRIIKCFNIATEQLENIVEIDETFVAEKHKNIYKNKQEKDYKAEAQKEKLLSGVLWNKKFGLFGYIQKLIMI